MLLLPRSLLQILDTLEQREKKQRDGKLSKVNFTMIHKEKLKRQEREAKYGVEARATRAFEKVFLNPNTEEESKGNPMRLSQEVYDLAVKHNRPYTSSMRSEEILKMAQERERANRVPESQQAVWDPPTEPASAAAAAAADVQNDPSMPTPGRVALEAWLPHQEMPTPRRRDEGDDVAGASTSTPAFAAAAASANINQLLEAASTIATPPRGPPGRALGTPPPGAPGGAGGAKLRPWTTLGGGSSPKQLVHPSRGGGLTPPSS